MGSSTVNSSLNEHNTTGNSSNAMPLTGGAPVNLHHSKTSNRSSSNDRNAPSGGGERISTLPSGVAVNREENVTNVRRRRKRARPSPIALEPCEGNRAAVLSLIVRMPTGGKPYTPNGYTGIAIASSLVTLGMKLCIFLNFPPIFLR